MNRRTLIGAVAIGPVVALSLAARAQRTRPVRTIGWLWMEAPPTPTEIARARHPGNLRALGWIEGQNLIVERRYTNGRTDLLKDYADELVRLKVDLIVADGTVATLAAKAATSTIPIVVGRSADPVRTGLVASLARPGGNVTGMSTIGSDTGLKQLQLLRELLPGVRRVAELEVPANPISREWRNLAEQAQRSLGLQLIFAEVNEASDLEPSIDEVVRRGAQAMHASAEPLLYTNRDVILRRTQMHSLPVMVDERDMLEAGGLMSYGADEVELDRQLAVVIDKVLRGAKPADLPIRQPTKYELMINLKTASALGVTVPQSLLLRANDVIR